jgi:hypothetical protein
MLKAIMEQRLGDLHVALPGTVVKFDSVNQTADVKPLLSRAVVFDDGDETQEIYPVIPSVPVVFPRGGGYFMSFPLAPGDNVLLVFIERSIDSYFYSAGQADINPIDLRKHDLSDAVAFPCFYPIPKALKEELSSGAVFGKEHGAQVRATGEAIEVVTAGASAATDFVAMSTKVLTELGKIKTAYDTHTHLYNPGPSAAVATATPLPVLPTASPVVSTNLKAD